ncbi:hypothetical protein Ddye_009243 [Dipteronia dyeriana]|uniref:Cation/H+ exchanger transmembrane domain-containing protein n=1 Tax=Dipteronia dyeriana TaxID=168575 RepID=A0AAD9XAZ4_9ROSI|nr:hypothetical protein Ddye_009243 [Dipteronia dyeriana]
MIAMNEAWQGDNPLDYSLPLFILQLTLVVVTTRLLVFVLKPFSQPRVISEIVGGVLLGPSVLGRSITFANSVFSLRSVMVLETMANVGLLYFLFLVGVEMDIPEIRKTGKKVLGIAIAGMVLPFIIGGCFSFLLHKHSQDMSQGTLIIFIGVALSIIVFPVLARILAELKLINTELGRIAMSSALVNDICAWILLAIAIALAENESTSLASLWMSIREGITLGLLMNTKGLVEMIILNVGKDQKVLDDESFPIMVIVVVNMTGIITPIVTSIYKPARRFLPYKCRTIQRL